MATQSGTQSKPLLQVRVRERWGSLGKEWSNQANKILYYYQPANTSRKVTLTKPSKNKRVVEGIFDTIEYAYKDLETAVSVTGNATGKGSVFTTGEFGEMAFIFDYITKQAAKLKKEKVWDGFTFLDDEVFKDFNDNSLFLGEWTSTKIINGITETHSPDYFGQSVNATDKKYRKKFGFRPPYWEIIQDPYVEGTEPNLRIFGNQGRENGYFLNNGAYVEIQWLDTDDITGEDTPPLLELAKNESSDNWGRELDISDITNTTSYKIDNVIKKATIYSKDGDAFTLAQEVSNEFDGTGTQSWNRLRKDVGFLISSDILEPFEPKIWKGKSAKYNTGILDSEILDEILKKWQQVYKNTKLKYCDPIGTECKVDLKYMSPVLGQLTTGTGASGASGASGSLLTMTGGTGGTGGTGSTPIIPPRPRVNGSYIFDVRRAGFFINYGTGGTGPGLTGSGLGELEILEKFTIEDPFNVPFADDITEVDSEYTEADYTGPEEDLDLVTGVSFTADELLRDLESVVVTEASPKEQKESGVEFGGSSVKSPSGDVSSSSVTLPSELAKVQNSSVITKQSMGGSFRSINSDIKAPSGDKLSGSEITKNMNEFVQDALGPFAKWLKNKYPDLYKGWYITSATRGYVPSGGSLSSQHMKGQAIDSQILGASKSNPQKNIDLCNAILEWYQSNPIGYGQILFETRDAKGSCWIHWSYKRGNTRLMFVRFSNDSTKSAPANKTGSYVKPTLTKASLGF